MQLFIILRFKKQIKYGCDISRDSLETTVIFSFISTAASEITSTFISRAALEIVRVFLIEIDI